MYSVARQEFPHSFHQTVYGLVRSEVYPSRAFMPCYGHIWTYAYTDVRSTYGVHAYGLRTLTGRTLCPQPSSPLPSSPGIASTGGTMRTPITMEYGVVSSSPSRMTLYIGIPYICVLRIWGTSCSVTLHTRFQNLPDLPLSSPRLKSVSVLFVIQDCPGLQGEAYARKGVKYLRNAMHFAALIF